jgi:hypothetical protein
VKRKPSVVRARSINSKIYEPRTSHDLYGGTQAPSHA